jgi:hypothetical protein
MVRNAAPTTRSTTKPATIERATNRRQALLLAREVAKEENERDNEKKELPYQKLTTIR